MAVAHRQDSGRSVATLPRWQNIRELVASRRAEGARVLVVVSALTGITDALKQLCAQGDQGKRNEAAKAIAQRHYDLLEHMQLALPDTLGARCRSGRAGGRRCGCSGRTGVAGAGAGAWRADVQRARCGVSQS
jgi:diaminopimelate decarboxylase/aspartate kinase